MTNKELNQPYRRIQEIIAGQNEYDPLNKEGFMPNRTRWAIGTIALLVILVSTPHIVDIADKLLNR